MLWGSISGMITNMELNYLQTFVVVAEEKSITQAAKRLFTTPSSISVHIKNLEDELGVQLFERSSRGMVITPKGEILLEKAKHTLQSVQDLVNHAAQMQAHLMGEVSLGLNASLGFLLIPRLLETLRSEAPGIQLQLVNQSTGRILEQISTGQLDIGFVYGPIADDRFHQIPLATIPLSVVGPIVWTDELANQDWAHLATYPWICSDYHCPFQEIIDQKFHELGLDYQPAIRTNDEFNRAELVQAGVGLSLLESSEVQRLASNNAIVAIRENEFHCALSVICLTYRQYDPLLNTVLQNIQHIWLAD